MAVIRVHTDLDVYKLSFESAMEIFECSKKFPKAEQYSLTDQIRRASRSVSVNIAEAWRHRRYSKSFISKLSIAEGEAAEVQVWLEFALACDYIDSNISKVLLEKYDRIIGKIVNMIHKPENWVL